VGSPVAAADRWDHAFKRLGTVLWLTKRTGTVLTDPTKSSNSPDDSSIVTMANCITPALQQRQPSDFDTKMPQHPSGLATTLSDINSPAKRSLSLMREAEPVLPGIVQLTPASGRGRDC
jgi:hypothetical protein